MKSASEMTPDEYRAARERIRRGLPPVATPTSPASARKAGDLSETEYRAARQRIRRGLPPFQEEPHR